jgi:hypothetical protein
VQGSQIARFRHPGKAAHAFLIDFSSVRFRRFAFVGSLSSVRFRRLVEAAIHAAVSKSGQPNLLQGLCPKYRAGFSQPPKNDERVYCRGFTGNGTVQPGEHSAQAMKISTDETTFCAGMTPTQNTFALRKRIQTSHGVKRGRLENTHVDIC